MKHSERMWRRLLGFIIGIVSGAVQFRMLSVFTGVVTGDNFNNRAVLFGIIQFFIPLIVLLSCAYLLPGSLLWVGLGMAVSLIVSALMRFIHTNRNSKGR